MFSSITALFNFWRRNRGHVSEATNQPQYSGAGRAGKLERVSSAVNTSQQELQRRWEYLAQAQRLSHSGIFAWKVSSGMLEWSDETYRILGFSREANPTLDLVFDRIHPEDRERLLKVRDLATRDGIDLDVEHRLLMPNGDIRYLHVVAHAGRNSSDNREYIGIVSDITERKRAEQDRQALSRDLIESKARLEEAQRVAHVGHWEWDLETNVIVWSDETYRIFGLKPQERPMDLATVRGMVHPEDREALYSGVDVEIDAGVQPVAEFRIVTPSGEVRTVHAITSKLWGVMPGDPDNEVSGKAYEMFGTVQDITERKRAEEELQVLYRELQESKASLEEAQRVAHVGSWVWDLEKNHVTYSDEYYRIFGLASGKSPIDIATVREMIHPEDRDYVFQTAEVAIRSGERAECEHRILRPNGEIRIVHSRGDLKKDASGRPYQMFGVSQDITDRTRAEGALKRSQFYLSEGERIAHIGSWAFNESGHYWSDELYKIHGLEPQSEAPTVEQYLALIHPQDRASMAETIKIMQERHRGHDLIERIIRPDGQLRYVRAVAVPVVEEGVFKGFIGTTMDVTEQELLTQELRRERAYLAEAQSLTHIGSWVA